MTSATDDAEDRVARMYEAYAPRLAAYALRRTSSNDAADVVAETFLVAWRRRDVVPDEPHTLPWLYGVARRVLSNQRRSQARSGRLRQRLALELGQVELEQPGPERSEEFRRVTNAMGKLAAEDAELLRLTAWEGLTPIEIATAMNLKPGTARQRIRRARLRLRKHLAADGLGPVEGLSVLDEQAESAPGPVAVDGEARHDRPHRRPSRRRSAFTIGLPEGAGR